MKKLFGILSLIILLFSTFVPSITYATDNIYEQAIKILNETLENINNNSNGLTNNLYGENQEINLFNKENKLNNLPENWEFDTITVARPSGFGDEDGPISFTIMDRNLGASKAGLKKSSYGYHYQRGNNHGFSSTGEISSTTTLAEWDSGYNNKGYYGEDFIITNNNTYWSDSNPHRGLWGGSGDIRGNSIIGSTAEQRQGPCPEGWHIPSIGERYGLIKYFAALNNIGFSYSYGNITGDQTDFINYFKLPLAGYRGSYTDLPIYSENTYGYFWSSSFKNNLYIGSQVVTAGSTMASDSQGISVRCFKNINRETEEHDITIIDGDDIIDTFKIKDGEMLINHFDFKNIEKAGGYIFLGRFDEDTGKKIDKYDYIGKDTRITSKYKKRPIYSYNTNGGIFGDGLDNKEIESTLIKSEKIINNPNQMGKVENVITITGSLSLNLNIDIERKCTNIVNIHYYDRTLYDDREDFETIAFPQNKGNYHGDFIIKGDTVTIETFGTSYCPSELYTGKIEAYSYNISKISEAPYYLGYEFSGWYELGSLEPFDFTGTEVTQDRILYAKWDPHHYTIHFNTGNIYDISATYGEEIILPIPIKEGYTFEGWKSEDGTTYTNTIPEGTGLTTEDGITVTLTAQWEKIEISPSAGGGSTINPTKQETKTSEKSEEQEHNSADTEKSGNTKTDNVKSSNSTVSESIKEQVVKAQERSLTRGEVAVMTNILLDVYPQLTENRELNEISEACENYSDGQNFTKDEKKAITRLCKLSIMGIHGDNNKPLDEFMVNEITKNDEFSKVINRSLSTYTEKDFSIVKEALKKLEGDEENVVFGTVYDVFMSIKNIFN